MRCVCCNKIIDMIELPSQEDIDAGAEELCNNCEAEIWECANGYDDLTKGWQLGDAVEGELQMCSDSDFNTSREPISDNFTGGIGNE